MFRNEFFLFGIGILGAVVSYFLDIFLVKLLAVLLGGGFFVFGVWQHSESAQWNRFYFYIICAFIAPALAWLVVHNIPKETPVEERLFVEKQKRADFKLTLLGSITMDLIDKSHSTAIALKVQIRNAGEASSIAADWRLYIKESGKEKVLAQFVGAPSRFHLKGKAFLPKSEFTLEKDASSQPLKFGQLLNGNLLFTTELSKKNIMNDDTILELTVDDIYGNTFSVTQRMGDWPSNEMN